MSILIVDDTEDMRLLLKRILTRAGYDDVVTAESAQDAFRILRVGDGVNPEIDLVLMDIVMPGMDGIEACRVIKAAEEYRDVPVLMVTVKPENEELQVAFEAGATDFIRKPVERSVFLARVAGALRLKREIDARKAREAELLEIKSQLEEANMALARLVSLDGLTGIANRRRFEEHLDAEWRRALREGLTLSVIMVDIDCFKQFNDTYGHPAGDECLQTIARTLSESLRRPGDLVARYGGEEMAVILQGTDLDGASAVAECLRSTVEALDIPHERSYAAQHVTISLGVATAAPTPDGSPDALVSAADRALYRAKASGRNRVCISSDQI